MKKSALSRPYQVHVLLYETEFERVARKAKEVTNDAVGQGHSNKQKNKFNVLTRFQSKSRNLHQVHYEFSINRRLCQSNMTFMHREERLQYHFISRSACPKRIRKK